MLAVTRGAAVVCGAVAVALAIVSPTIIGVIGVFYGLLGVSLFVPILAGLYLRRAGTPEALASIGCGVATMVGGALHDRRPRDRRHDAGARRPRRRRRSGFWSFSSRG